MKRKKRKHTWADWKLTLLALPFAVWIFMFKYVPILGWGLAFTNYKPGRSLDKLQFVGLKYFKLVGYYWKEIRHALGNSIILSLLSLLTMILPLIFAVCLNEISSPRLKKSIQSIVTIPHFVSWIIVYSLFFSLFSSNGLVNRILINAGILKKPILLLSSLKLARPVAVISGIWKELGWSAIVYLAAIAGIEQSQYEAAKIDGAGRFACAIHITIPNLIPTYIVLLVLKIGHLLQNSLDKYLLFKNPVNSEHLNTLELFVYQKGLLEQDYGFGIAMGIVMSVVSIMLISIANVLSKKVRGTGVI